MAGRHDLSGHPAGTALPRDAWRTCTMARPMRLAAFALAAPLILAACTTDGGASGGKDSGGGGGIEGGDLTFPVITHGSAGGPFLEVVQNRAEAAGGGPGRAGGYPGRRGPQRPAQPIRR